MEHAKAILLQDLRGENKFDSLNEEWAEPKTLQFGDSQVEMHIVDESSKLNPNFLRPVRSDDSQTPPNKLQKLAEAIGIAAEDVGRRVADWIDRDDEGRYETEAANTRLASAAHILRIPGIDGRRDQGGLSVDELAKLLPHLTVWSDGRINVNTAPEPVLAVLLPDRARDIATDIVSHRREHDFERTTDVQSIEGFSAVPPGQFFQRAATRSDVYRVNLVASRGAAMLRASAVLKRAKDNVEVLHWSEGADISAQLRWTEAGR